MSKKYKVNTVTEGYIGDITAPDLREAFRVAMETENPAGLFLEDDYGNIYCISWNGEIHRLAEIED